MLAAAMGCSCAAGLPDADIAFAKDIATMGNVPPACREAELPGLGSVVRHMGLQALWSRVVDKGQR